MGHLVNVAGNLTANTPHFMLLCFTDEMFDMQDKLPRMFLCYVNCFHFLIIN